MSTHWVALSCALALVACDDGPHLSDGSIERDGAISDAGGLLDGGQPADGAATDAGEPDAGWICDISACDPRDETSCDTGLCALWTGEPTCEDAHDGVLAPGAVCAYAEDCAAGLACFMTLTGGVCARPCCLGDEVGCAVGSRCGGSGRLVDRTETSWGRCLSLRSCELLRPVCEEREGCYLLDGSGMTECRIAGTSGAGERCSVQEECQAGFFCGGLASQKMCIRLCAVAADTCPVAEGRCVQQAHTPVGVGLCTMDAMTARMN